MYKIFRGVKNCTLFSKNMPLFLNENFCALFVRFLVRLDAPLSSELLATLTTIYPLVTNGMIRLNWMNNDCEALNSVIKVCSLE